MTSLSTSARRGPNFRNPDCSPTLGRFLERGPLAFNGSDMNLYRYVRNSPIDQIDPFGLIPARPPQDKAEPPPCACEDALRSAAAEAKKLADDAESLKGLIQLDEVLTGPNAKRDKIRDTVALIRAKANLLRIHLELQAEAAKEGKSTCNILGLNQILSEIKKLKKELETAEKEFLPPPMPQMPNLKIPAMPKIPQLPPPPGFGPPKKE
jgi:hypothetical protein